jgi:NitT/TauT family transport system substrate-binding protein
VAPAPAFAQTALTVGKANATSDAITPVNVGDKLGIFKKHGLDLKIVDFGGGSKMVQALTAGAIDIGDGAGTEMAFIAKGAPMLAVCESTGPAPFLGVGVPWDSPITKLADLKGKSIGVSSPDSFSDWSAHQLARKFGWGPNDVKTVATGGGPAVARRRSARRCAPISSMPRSAPPRCFSLSRRPRKAASSLRSRPLRAMSARARCLPRTA